MSCFKISKLFKELWWSSFIERSLLMNLNTILTKNSLRWVSSMLWM